MAQTRVVVLNETTLSECTEGNWSLWFQYCRYEYGDNTEQNGYRFIWKRPDGSLQAARGQARIPSISELLRLTSKAIEEGWGHHKGDVIGFEDK